MPGSDAGLAPNAVAETAPVPARAGIAALAVATMLAVGTAEANPYAPAYDDSELSRVQSGYSAGILGNFRDVILPRLDPAQADQLSGVTFDFPLTVDQAEPMAFYSSGQTVTLSATSIRFLDDVSTAAAWLNENDYSLASLTDYVSMLKYGVLGDSPPKPLDALCVPADALNDPDVAATADVQFNVGMVFIMLHELAHVLYAHPGYDGVDPAVARANEAEADRFALDGLRRLDASPLPMIPLFTVWAHMAANRGDFRSEAELQAHLARQTHPLHSSRIADIAAMLAEEDASAALAGQVLDQIVTTLDTEGVQQIMALAGVTALEANLAPRRHGEFLGTPCGYVPDGQDFSGVYDGVMTIGGVEFGVNLVLNRNGTTVRGASSYGAATYVIEGEIAGDWLAYRWSAGDLSGRGQLALGPSGGLSGTWGENSSANSGGTVALSRRDPP
jgi:hypothetical protein